MAIGGGGAHEVLSPHGDHKCLKSRKNKIRELNRMMVCEGGNLFQNTAFNQLMPETTRMLALFFGVLVCLKR